jgi:putative ABC transport system ATP-binding protein
LQQERAPGKAAAASNGHVVHLRQVGKVYETPAGRFTALRGIDLQVGPGEFCSIIGKSGSGKSTLINVITGIDRPTAGEVEVGHTAVHALNEEEIALWRGRTVGVIFQFFQLLPTLTAVENVILPMDYAGLYAPSERPERAMRLLEQVGMAEHAHKLPSALSGGQQQRVAIARALANDPPLVTADEPTGNLDSQSARSVLKLFHRLVGEGKTILMVTHDRDLAAQAQRTMELADGEIVGDWMN